MGAYDDAHIVPQVPLVDSNTDAAARAKPKPKTYGDVVRDKVNAGVGKWVLGGLLLYALTRRRR